MSTHRELPGAVLAAAPARVRGQGPLLQGGAGFGISALEQAAIHEQRAIRRQLQAVATAGDANGAAVMGEVWVGHGFVASKRGQTPVKKTGV